MRPQSRIEVVTVGCDVKPSDGKVNCLLYDQSNLMNYQRQRSHYILIRRLKILLRISDSNSHTQIHVDRSYCLFPSAPHASICFLKLDSLVLLFCTHLISSSLSSSISSISSNDHSIIRFWYFIAGDLGLLCR